MILVDSSVWISYLNGIRSRETDFLDETLGQIPILIPDLVYMEVLQGFREDRSFEEVKTFLDEFPFAELGGKELALLSARNFRELRKKGITVRKTIDCYLATFCIQKDLKILHADRDFAPFVQFLGLKSIF
ncbi:type II toxin-antitoxin system VapC family toxin [Algoriphagus taiwanensis]|uniref:Ribonuclease VapC n=1 Tax=Algoriphagus taiwanensis TaxID=1445656 RepID=A0ABQ6PX77_9BACT|nr:PIN domain nuclease [Algoriphagus taiwanensis]